MDLKGCSLELAHRNSQASVPFYVSSLGYGFLWHNAAIGEVHFGSNTTEWTAEETPAKILESYTRVTGRAPMMPEYGLGFWQCKELSTNNCCKFMAIFIVFPGFCLKQLQQLFSDNS